MTLLEPEHEHARAARATAATRGEGYCCIGHEAAALLHAAADGLVGAPDERTQAAVAGLRRLADRAVVRTDPGGQAIARTLLGIGYGPTAGVAHDYAVTGEPRVPE